MKGISAESERDGVCAGDVGRPLAGGEAEGWKQARDMSLRPFSFRKRLHSIRYAFRGAWLILRTQHAVWVQSAIGLAVIAGGLAVGLSRMEWCVIALAVAAVLTAEGMNTGLEYLSDVVCTERHPGIEKVKDIAAGAVLFAAAGSIVVGLLVFWPHLWK